MATFVWYAQDTNSGTNTILATEELSWWGSVTTPAYLTPIPTNEYNSNTHVETVTPTDKCTTYHTNNLRYVDSDEVVINETGGAQTLAAGVPTEGEMPIKITFSDTGVTITDAEFFMYDQSTETNPPTGLTVFGIEQGDVAWTAMTGGSDTPITLDDHATPANDHDYFIGVSMSPTSIGAKTAIRMKITLTYQ